MPAFGRRPSITDVSIRPKAALREGQRSVRTDLSKQNLLRKLGATQSPFVVAFRSRVLLHTLRASIICSKFIPTRSEEHTSELQSLMRISYAVFCLKKKKKPTPLINQKQIHKTEVHTKP